MAQAISILGVHYATIYDFLVGERDNDYGGVGPILEIPRGVVPAFTGDLQFRYGSATKYTFRAVAGDECVGNAMASNLANIAVIDGGGFNLDFRNENIHFENIYVHNFTLTTTGDSYDGLSFKGGVVDCYFYLKNSAPTLGVSTDNTTIVLNSGDPESGVDKVVDISGLVPFHGLNTTVINKAGGVSGATGVIYNRSSAVSTFNYVCVFSATNSSYVASGAGVPTGANNCAHDALMPGSVSDGVTAADFMDLANGDYRIKAESVPGLLGIGAHIQPVVNVDPVLDTPLGDYSFVVGSSGSVTLGGNFSDANVGDTLTFTDPVPALPSGYTFDNSNAKITRDGTQVEAAQATFTITASDGHGGNYPTGTFTLTTTPIVPVINDIDTDNDVKVGQSAITISTAGLPGTLPAGLVLQLQGKPLTLLDWTGGQLSVSVPTGIDLKWGSTDNQLSINYTGLVDGPITLDNVTLSPRDNWTVLIYGGDIPDVKFKSLYKSVLTDAVLGNYTMLAGDVVVYERAAALSYDSLTRPIVDPAGDVSGAFKIWKNVEGTFTPLSSYEWFNDGLPADIDAPIFQSLPAISGLTESAFNVDFTASEDGNYRFVFIDAGDEVPTSTEVLSGTGRAGAATLFSSALLSMTAGVEVSTPATGFSAGTAGVIYTALVDADGNEQLSAPLSVETITPVINPPVITLQGNAVVALSVGDNYVDAGATAVDGSGADITGNIVVSGLSFDTNLKGTYTVRYNVSADSLDAVEVSRTIVVNLSENSNMQVSANKVAIALDYAAANDPVAFVIQDSKVIGQIALTGDNPVYFFAQAPWVGGKSWVTRANVGQDPINNPFDNNVKAAL